MSTTDRSRSPADLRPVTLDRVPRAKLPNFLASLELDPDQVERFLGPLEDIVSAVQSGSAHALLSLTTANNPIGFCVLHPDRRNSACWWLGWFALDRRRQGHGYGRAGMAGIMAWFRRIPACRRIRLLVASDNRDARRIYTQAGFRQIAIAETGELILEAIAPAALATSCLLLAGMIRAAARAGHRSLPGRLRLLAGPYAARMIGVERGPPDKGLWTPTLPSIIDPTIYRIRVGET